MGHVTWQSHLDGPMPAATIETRVDIPTSEPSPNRLPEQPRWLAAEDDDRPLRQPLTRRRIVLAALGLVEEHGLDALTMRRVASELHVTPMSLYNHVADKSELVDLMVDLILGDVVSVPVDTERDWKEQLRSICRLTHEVWRAHPGLARVYSSGVTIGPNGLANIERVIRILRSAGFSDQDAADGFFLLYRYMVASLLMGRTLPVRTKDRAMRSDGSGQDRIEKYFSALPSDQIPNTAAVAALLSGDDFEFGLDVMMTGLEARLAAAQARAGGD